MTSNPSTSELVALGAPTLLPEGSRVRLRQGRPADKELLLRGFERLSEESRYRRFLAPMPELREPMLSYLLDVDPETIDVHRFRRRPQVDLRELAFGLVVAHEFINAVHLGHDGINGR